MKVTRTDGHQCRQAQRQIDAYIDSELLVESSLDLQEHFERCAECSRSLEARKEMRDRLRSAAREVAVPFYLDTRIRARVRATRPQPLWMRPWLAASVAVVCVGFFAAWQVVKLQSAVRSQENHLAGMSARIGTLMRIGLADHLHCSVFRKYPDQPPALADLTATMGPRYAGMIPIAMQHVPPDFRLYMAHICRDHRRTFLHLTFRRRQQVLSLAIVRKKEGESFAAGELPPALSRAGIAVYAAGVQNFQIAAFENAEYLVYTISDLPRTDNLNVMVALASPLHTFLESL